jgi:predicted DNA-binding protein (UPF0251 family)
MRKKRNSIPADHMDKVVADYLNGASTVELANRYSVTPPAIAYQLKKKGVSLRTRSELNHMRAPVDVDELLRLIDEANLSQREIAERLGVSLPTIERTLRRIGVKSNKGRGSPMEKNYFWNGGRTIDSDGYVLLKVPDHPFADNRGYVREHRLVMEEHLGRYLDPEEVVHHIDGNHQNNDIGNLELFQTNGKHLHHELTGQTPNYTPEGLQRMRENALRLNRQRYAPTHQE